MKSLQNTFLFILAIIVGSCASKTIYTESIPIAGNTYLISGDQTDKLSREGLRNWSNANSKYGIYWKSDQAINAELLLKSNDLLTHGAKISAVLNGDPKTILIDAGKSQVSLGEFNLKKGYNVLELVGLEKEAEVFMDIDSLLVQTTDSIKYNFVKDNIDNRGYWGRRGPSVHLSYEMPEAKEVKWFYSEITVPEGGDPLGSYYMANGFAEGYFGIQTNSVDERRVLFSVWSPFHTDNPNEIPDDQKITMLKKGENVNTGEFGNEGSGGQSFLRYYWKTGNTYGFLNSVEPDGKGNTIYTAYFFAPEVSEWQLIASFKRPKTDTWYKRAHSFLENFSDRNGYLSRKAHYHNQWVRDIDGNWIRLTKAQFTGDDIAKRAYRQDFEGGVEGNQFFMKNGGFFDSDVLLGSKFNVELSGDAPEIDFAKLK